MPVFAFDEQDAPAGLPNYWGYSPCRSSRRTRLTARAGPARRARRVPRHGEGAASRRHRGDPRRRVQPHGRRQRTTGPTICFRGLDNARTTCSTADRPRYTNYTGCGNTLNGNHPVVRRMIVDCLRYWVSRDARRRLPLRPGIDPGARSRRAVRWPTPPVLWDIAADPVLADTKLIAEAWDAAGLYQVGSFLGDRWAEWNGHFRDDVRVVPEGRRRRPCGRWPRGSPAARTSTSTSSGSRSTASTSSPATTGSR